MVIIAMSNPVTPEFNKAVLKLKEVLSKTNSSNDLFLSENSVLSTYGGLFFPSRIGGLKKSEFVGFLQLKNNHHWTLMNFQAKNLTQDMGKLKAALTALLDETKSIDLRIDGMPKVKGMGRGIYSPILLVGTNQKYGVWNLKSEKFLKEYNLMPKGRGKSKGVIYKEFNDILHDLANSLGVTLWVLDGLFHFHMFLPRIPKEFERRRSLWNGLTRDIEDKVEHKELSSKKIKVGQRSINAPILKGLDERITLSVMVTGTKYSEEIGDTELIYHYPDTKLVQQDKNEINGMKSAIHYGLPIFVIIGNKSAGTKRTVKLGLVSNYDDQAKTFLINLLEVFPKTVSIAPVVTPEKFALKTKSRNKRTANVNTRPDQPKFRFDVMKRYGPKCAVCDLTLDPTLEAAHIYPVSEDGSDHEENGLVMCANHHKIFDSHFFAILPNFTLEFKPGVKKSDLRIIHDDISHLSKKPHQEALDARYKLFKKANKPKK